MPPSPPSQVTKPSFSEVDLRSTPALEISEKFSHQRSAIGGQDQGEGECKKLIERIRIEEFGVGRNFNDENSVSFKIYFFYSRKPRDASPAMPEK